MPDSLTPQLPPTPPKPEDTPTSDNPVNSPAPETAVSPPVVTPIAAAPAESPNQIVEGDLPSVDSNPAQSALPASPPQPKSRRPLWITLTAVVFVLAVLGGYVLTYYLPNTPGHVFSASLVDSGKAVNQLLNYSRQQESMNYKSTSVTGALNVKSGATSTAFTLSAVGNKYASEATASGNVLGTVINTDFRFIRSSSSVLPDTFVQINGSGANTLLGDVGLAKYNGKWIEVSSSYLKSLEDSTNSTLNSSSVANLSSSLNLPTSTQVNDAISKVQTVSDQYLFTTNSKYAVLTNEKYLGKATLNGRMQDTYTVGYNKNNLASYFGALGTALDGSQLNDWSKANDHGKTLSQLLDISQLESNIEKSKGTYTFKLWADTKTKLVSQIAFTDPSDKSTVFTIAQNYTGGNTYPFSLGLTDKEDGTTESSNLGLSLDTVTHVSKLNFSATSGKTTISANLNITPSNKAVTVTAPDGAIPIATVLSSFGIEPEGSSSVTQSSSGSPNVPATPSVTFSVPPNLIE